jgi:hypothetical protein
VTELNRSIDLNALFIAYAKKHVSEPPATREEQLALMERLQREWEDAPDPVLAGLSPREYLKRLSPDMLVRALKSGKNDLLLEVIALDKRCVPYLLPLVGGGTGLSACAVELLAALGASEPLEEYISIIKAGDDPDLTELVIERLKENIDAAGPLLIGEIEGAGGEFRAILAEILSYGGHDDRVLGLLTDLFLSGENIPFYAGLLGRYGDERAAAVLYPALDRTDYADYIDIKNAVERLGGVVDEQFRDFTYDETYRLIKESGTGGGENE